MASQLPLPPGWTENKAPSGHIYYYNAQTKESTYRRPGAAPASANLPPAPPPRASAPLPAPPAIGSPLQDIPGAPFPHRVSFTQPSQQPFPHYGPQAPLLNLSDPRVANAFMAQQNTQNTQDKSANGSNERGGYGGRGGRGGRGGTAPGRPRPQPNDKPRSRFPIPGQEPWVLVYTKYGRRFVYNSEKKTSFWRIPEKLMPAILEMDKAGISLEHKDRKDTNDAKDGKDDEEKVGDVQEGIVIPLAAGYDSEYEEIEVTDEEGGEEDGDETRRKRQRTEEADTGMDDGSGDNDGPVEFTEDDIAYQLAAANGMMDDQYYDDDGGEDYGDEPYFDAADHGAHGGVDGTTLFKELLDDFKINPFSAWEKLIEEGLIFDDPRYTALSTMKARKAAWEEWSRERIREKKERDEEEKKAKKKDPKAAYLKLLQDFASPKLYWPEFKRKYRKEPAMKDALHPPEKEKEKLYRDYVARRKLPAATRKADLLKLIESLPKTTSAQDGDLPPELTSDLRYVAVEPAVRDPLVDAYYK